MEIQMIKDYRLGDMIARYYLEEESRRMGFFLLPAALRDKKPAEKRMEMEPLVQLKLSGDTFGESYGLGSTMRNSRTVRDLQYSDQTCEETEKELTVHTALTDERGYRVIHHLHWKKGTAYVKLSCTFENRSEQEAVLQMLESFSLGGLSPYVGRDGYGKLYLHRIRSAWSQEGPHEERPVEDLLLVPSWGYYAVRCERFGQAGSMPVNRFFPFAAVEDRENHIFWGAQIKHPASWQMEVYRRDDGLALSGGLADEDFGHWKKAVAPGGSFTSPEAIVSVAHTDSFDVFTGRLTSEELESFSEEPKIEQDLPIVFNEYCTTWGCPSHENITGILDAIRGKGFTYFVIDAGWYKQDGVPWDLSMGDYEVSDTLFPDGMEKTVEAIRDAGLIPGLWFEIENVGRSSKAWQMEEHLLHRDGTVLESYARRFWDMRDPWVQNYLSEKVIGTLEKYGFGYMKIDCNETIGIGCDGAESYGEGLRQDMEASMAFLEKVKQEIPGIILENCASGGHRLEPSWMDAMCMASFSDAHELIEIPIIAAHLHRVIHPVKSQIWAVIRMHDSLQRIAWSIANTFLGRMCLSGDVTELSKEQWKMITDGIAFYRRLVPIIRSGQSYLYGPRQCSFRHPERWQAVVRIGQDGKAFVLIHTFAGDLPSRIYIPLPEGCPERPEAYYSDTPEQVVIRDHMLIYVPWTNYKAVAVLLS